MTRIRTVCAAVGFLGLSAGAGCGGATAGGDLTSAADGGGAPSSGSSGAPGTSPGSAAEGGVSGPAGGPGGSATTITCGTTSCAIPAQACCVEQATGGVTFSCSAANAACPGTNGNGNGNGNGGDTTALRCSGAANCTASTVCCVRQANNGSVSECKASCGQNEAQLCDPNATLTGCAANLSCSSKNIGSWGLPTAYATCGGKGN